MNAHELMLKTNHYLITGGTLTDGQKRRITDDLLTAVSSTEQAERFYRGVRYPCNFDEAGRRMYPYFFIPPYNNGEKYRTVTGQLPQTHILSANSYELEILRLLVLFAEEIKHPMRPHIQAMHRVTVERLKTTCYGTEDDGVGECFYTAMVVLRYLAPEARKYEQWIRSRIDLYHSHADEKYRPPESLWYYRLCLTELPPEIVRDEITAEQYRLRKENSPETTLARAIGERLMQL